MSANDLILIKELKDKFNVFHCDADTGAPYSHIGDHKTLRGAVRLANAYEITPEYNLIIHLLEKEE